MATDPKIVEDILTHVEAINDVKAWLDKVYYIDEFSTMFTKPVIKMLITACDYLAQNLEILSAKYITRTR